MTRYEPYCCPKCKATDLELLSDTIKCMKCDYSGHLNKQNVPEFLYVADSQDIEGKKVDDDFLPEDPSRKFKVYGSMKYFANLLIRSFCK